MGRLPPRASRGHLPAPEPPPAAHRYAYTRRSALAPSRTLSVGMDGHTESSAVAYVAHAYGAEVVSLGPSGTRQGDLAKRIRQLQSKSPPRVFVDEAGPCGYWLSRSLTKKGDVCWVVAPSWMPQKAGARVNNPRRDARQLARLMRSGALTPVALPAAHAAALG